MSALIRLIVRAAPTCILWQSLDKRDALQFRLWPRWQLTHQAIEEAV